MRIVITGNLGYVGPCAVHRLRVAFPDACLIGLDTGYFSGCLLDHMPPPERELDQQYFADLRALPRELFRGADAVIHLAGLSNDPMGSRFEAITDEINFVASLDLARAAREAGARHFAFASSCSVYGSAEETPRTETSVVNPLTAYARSKVATEEGLAALAGPKFTVTCLRFATACGLSSRLRLDLVLNDFVAAAISQSEIRVLSDGKPWRPLIHVRDMARAIEWAVTREQSNGGKFLIVNTGSDSWTYQVSDLACAVSECVSGATVSINSEAPHDLRSYKVDFSLFRRLAPNHQPAESLTNTILELKHSLARFLESTPVPDASRFIRLRTLSDLLEHGYLNRDLTWSRPNSTAIANTAECVLAGKN